MIYNVIYATACLFNILFFGGSTVRKSLYFVLLAFLFCFVAFRYEVGCDWGSYYNHTLKFSDLTFGEALELSEPGYWVALVLLREGGIEYPGINILGALSFFGGLHMIARRQPDPLLYLTLAFPILTTGIAMSALRQAMAMGFVAMAFLAFADRKLIAYIIWLVVAGLFHKSAYTLLIMAPFIYRKGQENRGIVGILLALPCLYLATRTDAADQYANLYVGTEHDAAGGIFRVGIVFLTGAVFLLLFRTRWRSMCSSDFELALYLSLLSLVMVPLVLYSSVLGDRFGYFLMLVTGLIQARFYRISSPPTRWLYFLAPMVVSGVALLAWSQLSGIFDVCYGNYRTWWSS